MRLYREREGGPQRPPNRAHPPTQGLAQRESSPPPGWYPFPTEPTTQRYWDGSAWTKTNAEKLDAKITALTIQGYRVEFRSDTQAVMVKGKRPNHVLHLLLTIFTLGLWGIVWIILAITMHERRRIITPA